MDHIPSPFKPTHDPIRVPYLVKDAHTYDDLGFCFTFPSRIGFEIGNFDEGNTIKRLDSLNHVSFEDACSLVQATFYFGFLHDIATQAKSSFPYDPKFFIKQDAQGRRVSSKYLAAFFDIIYQNIDHTEPGLPQVERLRRRQQLNILNNILSKVRDFLRLCDSRSSALFHHSELPQSDFFVASSILLSITIVAEMLSTLINIQDEFSMGYFPQPKILKDRLKSSGWCPYAIVTAERRFASSTVLYYLSRMRHGTADQDHSRCTPKICQRSQLDESKYEQKHTPNCNRDECFEYLAEDYRFQQPENRPISKILKAGSVPKVLINSDGYIGETTAQRYVAISHVWSDGLGNPHCNSLHSCQIGRLQLMVNDLYPGESERVPFWIDTICVPLDPETRKLAISGMKHVYERADRVLILDSTLLDAPHDMGIYETIMRVATCTWSTRLWTLQEAIFQENTIYALPLRPWTSELLFGIGVMEHFEQFKLPPSQSNNILTDPQIKKRAYLNQILAFGSRAIEWQGKPSLDYSSISNQVGGDHTLSRIVFTLNTRSTSKLEDEPICLASLLGIDPAKLWETNDRLVRMRYLFRSFKQIPTGFLFSPRPRIREYGCRWMPQSLLWTEESTTVLGDYNLSSPVDQDGMLVSMPGVRFPNGVTPNASSSQVIIVELDGGEIDGHHYEKATYEISFSFPKPESMKNPEDPWAACKGKDVAIVMSHLLGKDWLGRRACILVTVRELDEDFVVKRMGEDPEMGSRLFARYEACVNVRLAAKGVVADFFIGDFKYEALDEDQKWCIG